MKNYWNDQIRLKEFISLITKCLNDDFIGTLPNRLDWLRTVEDLIDALHKDDITIIAGLMRYEIIGHLDEFGLIEMIEMREI